MNFSASFVERTIVAVDYFINRAISGAWESVCRSALGYKRQQPPRITAVVTFARWRRHVLRRTINRSNRESRHRAQRHQLAAEHLYRIIERPPPASVSHSGQPLVCSSARRNTDPAMVAMLLIAGCVGVLAVGTTFAVIIYFDARAERRRQQ